MGLGFAALGLLPLPEAIALGYAAPLFATGLAALVLKETVRLFRWTAVLVGLAGVLVILWPRLTLLQSGGGSESETIGAMAAIGAAILAAISIILVRQLVQKERTPSIVLLLFDHSVGRRPAHRPVWLVAAAGNDPCASRFVRRPRRCGTDPRHASLPVRRCVADRPVRLCVDGFRNRHRVCALRRNTGEDNTCRGSSCRRGGNFYHPARTPAGTPA